MLPNILIAAGNYDITFAVRSALESEAVSVRGAYTHRDTLYMLSQERYQALIVDAAMFDRDSGEYTIQALERLKNPLPRIAVALDATAEHRARDVSNMIIAELNRDTIRKTVIALVGSVMPQRKPQTTNLMNRRRMEEIDTLFRVSKSLTEVLDLSAVLNRVVEAARELTNADEGMILMPEEVAGEEQLMLRAKVGFDVETARNFRVRINDSIAGEVLRSGKPTMDGQRGPLKVKTQHLVLSLLYVPIQFKDRVIGVLGVNNREKQDAFDVHHQDLLMNLAAYAAIAIENARVHAESVQRNKELQTLVEATQIMSTSLAMSETLAHVCEQVRLVLDASRVDVYNWEEHQALLQRRACAMASLWPPLGGPVVQVPDSNDAAALKRGDVIWQDSVGQDSYYGLLIPIISEGDLAGVLRACYLVRPTEHSATRQLRNVRDIALEALANLLTTAPEDPEVRRRSVMEKMGVINLQLGCDWSEIMLTSESVAALFTLAQVGKAVWPQPPFEEIDLDQASEYQGVLLKHRVLEQRGTSAQLALALVHRGKSWGLLRVIDNEPRRAFSPREVSMAKALASQAASSLENARLHTELDHRHRELKDTQQRLVETARYSAMGELAGVVAHQINNPLTTIIVDAELLLMQANPDSREYRALEAIHHAGRKASSVARRLLSVVRPDNSDDRAELIDVAETIRGALSLMGAHIQRRNIKISTRIPGEDDPALPGVLAVRGRLDEIWMNLLSNAYDAMVEHPNSMLGIELDHYPDKRQIVVRVWDNGPGMPESVRQRIFDPFYTTKPPGEGTGLGLHICRQTVEEINGTIDVESFEGQGTRFTITLPTVTRAEVLRG